MATSKSTGTKSSRRGSRGASKRRSSTKGFALLRQRIRRGWFAVLEMPAVWVGLLIVVGTWILLPQRFIFEPRIEAGSIASRTWIADRDLQMTDEVATRSLQERASENVLPVYDRDRSLQADRRRRLAAFFAQGRALLQAEEQVDTQPAGGDGAAGEHGEAQAVGIQERLTEAGSLKVTSEQLALLVEDGFSSELEDRLAGLLTRILRQGVIADKELLLEHRVRGITIRELPSGREVKELDIFRFLDYPDQVRDAVEDDLRTWAGTGSGERALFAEMVLANVSPNLNFNSSETLDRRRQAAESVGSVTHTFGQGEVIVRRGARITTLQARALREQAGDQDLAVMSMTMVGTLMLLASVAFLIWLALSGEKGSDRSRERMLGECLLLLTLSLTGAQFGSFVAEALAGAIEREPFNVAAGYAAALPYAAPALVAVLLYGRNTALVISLCFSILVGYTVAGEDQWATVVYGLAGSFAAIFALDNAQFRQRSMMTRAGWVVGSVNMVSVLALVALAGRIEGGPAALGFQLVCGFAGGFISAAVTSFVVPIFESLLQITTSIKLIELANPNLPLLRRLAFEAPGTFQHSLAVANLAKAGVEAVEGDSVLIHTAALYHDIGKLIRPQYFIENQQLGGNPHDRIQPSMSALILINHVKEGLELGEKYALPTPIMDSIEQHHGTRLIKYFYNRAKDRCDPDTDEIREDEFRYPGPKPQSKEMGVLMLADAVEAASRTLIEPSTQKIRAVLRAVFDDCLNDGQLDQTDLTLGDLKRVEEAFHRILTNIYHRRIEYPGFDFNRTRGRSEESRTAIQKPPKANGDSGKDEPRKKEAAGKKDANGKKDLSGRKNGTVGKEERSRKDSEPAADISAKIDR